MTITPDQADRLKRAATDGPWFVHTDPDDVDGTYIHDDTGHMCVAIEPRGSDYRPADLELAAAAPDLAQAIAAQTWEYRAEEFNEPYWHPITEWSEEWPLHDGHTPYDNERIVRRLVGPVEVVE